MHLLSSAYQYQINCWMEYDCRLYFHGITRCQMSIWIRCSEPERETASQKWLQLDNTRVIVDNGSHNLQNDITVDSELLQIWKSLKIISYAILCTTNNVYTDFVTCSLFTTQYDYIYIMSAVRFWLLICSLLKVRLNSSFYLLLQYKSLTLLQEARLKNLSFWLI